MSLQLRAPPPTRPSGISMVSSRISSMSSGGGPQLSYQPPLTGSARTAMSPVVRYRGLDDMTPVSGLLSARARSPQPGPMRQSSRQSSQQPMRRRTIQPGAASPVSTPIMATRHIPTEILDFDPSPRFSPVSEPRQILDPCPLYSPVSEARQILERSPVLSYRPESKLVEAKALPKALEALIDLKVKIQNKEMSDDLKAMPKIGDEPKFVESACDSLNIQYDTTETPSVRDEIATIKQSIVGLGCRCEEILDLARELARELDIERNGRKAAIEEVCNESRKIYEDLEQSMVEQLQQHNEQSYRWDNELTSVRVATEAAMGEISRIDQIIALHRQPMKDMQADIESMRHPASMIPGAEPKDDARCADAMQAAMLQRLDQRSWEEEAANIRAHIKRFQDTFSKSLSFERESRQKDMKLLMSTFDTQRKQAGLSEAFAEDKRKYESERASNASTNVTDTQAHDRVRSISNEPVMLQ